LFWGKAKFNITNVLENLHEDKDIRFVRRFGKLNLYETTKEPKKFYTVSKTKHYTSYDGDSEEINNKIKHFGPAEIMEKKWIRSGFDIKLSNSTSNSTLNLTYFYSKERAKFGWWSTRSYNTVPFNLSDDDYRYMSITLKTYKGAALLIRMNYSGEFETAVPMNLNSESTRTRLRSSEEYYTFEFRLKNATNTGLLEIGMGPNYAYEVGRYSAEIKEISFSKYPTSPSQEAISLLYLAAKNESCTKIPIVLDTVPVIWNNEDPPTIRIDEINPTNFHVSVVNAKTPFHLVSTMVYDEDWIAEVNGNQLEHIQVNGIFNGWVVKQTGDSLIKVYYRKQEAIDLFKYISLLSIFILCTISFLLLRGHD
jgi:hypothetical protein